MVSSKRRDDAMRKEAALKENGSYNEGYKNVTAALFQGSPFFDPQDIVQVKYEMLRSVTNDEKSVTEAAKEHGFSRVSFYRNQDMFDKGGLEALVPKKPGPKGANKFHKSGKEFVVNYLKKNPGAKATEIARQMETSIGLKVHPQTIIRFIEKKTGD